MSVSVRPLSPWLAGRTTRSATLVDCLLLLALASALRFAWLGSASLWSDELFSLHWSQLDPSFLLGQGAQVETNPPIYYLFLHAWMQVVGSTTLAVRLPSLLFSTATVLVIYAIGRTLWDRPTALLAGLFGAVDPTAVLFAQEARPYALVGLLDGLALLALASYARDFATSSTRPWQWLAVFMLAMIGSFLAHYTSLLFIAACFAVIGLHIVTTRPFPVREALIWIGAGVITALGIAKPLLTALSLSSSANISWIEPMSPWRIRMFFMDILLHPGIPSNAVTIASSIVLVLVLVTALPRFRADRTQLGVLVLIPVVFCLLLIGVSVSRPMLISRVGVWLTIPLCLLLARAATLHSTRLRRTAAATVSSLIFLSSLGHYFWAFEKEDWRSAAHLAIAEPQCNGPVMFSGGSGLGLFHYEPLLANRSVYAIISNAGDSKTAEYMLNERLMHPGTLDVNRVAEFTQTHPHTMVVMRQHILEAGSPVLSGLLEHTPFRAKLGGNLIVSCF